MSDGPDLPRPIYPGGEPPTGQPPAAQPTAPQSEPAAPQPQPQAPAPQQAAPQQASPQQASPPPRPASVPPSSGNPVHTAPPSQPSQPTPGGSGGGKKALLVGLVAALVLGMAGVGYLLLTGDDPKDPGGNGGDTEASARSQDVAQNALGDFPRSDIDCMAGKLDDDSGLLDALEPIAGNSGFTFSDSDMATRFADAMSACVDQDTIADQLASQTGGADADCVRQNAAAWTDDEKHDFIEASVDPSQSTLFELMQSTLKIC